MDVLTISRRLGHGTSLITLDVYGHMLKPSVRSAAAIFDKAFGGQQGAMRTKLNGPTNTIGGGLVANGSMSPTRGDLSI
jgi:hypothetical protein